MSKRPVLGIICCTRTVGTEPAQAVMNRYVLAALHYADVNALLVPALPDLVDAADIVERLDGLLLTGSPSNVAPTRYGGSDDTADGPFDPARDEMVMRLVARMTDKSSPVFGICRGFQELNVALGGSLRGDVAAQSRALSHHALPEVGFADMFAHRHPVDLAADGILHRALRENTIEVNSVHFQGVDVLAPDLCVEATAPDGLVEAFSTHINAAPVLAVQWHPEWETDKYPQSQQFFTLLGRALRGDRLTRN